MATQNEEEKFITLTFTDSDISTLSEFMDKEHIYNIKPQELFDKNRDLIWSQMSIEDFEKNSNPPKSSSDLTYDMVLPRPCKLIIPAKNLLKEVIITQTNVQTDETDFSVFSSEAIQNSINSPEIVASNENGNYSKIKQEVSVFGWFKTNGFNKQTTSLLTDTLFTDLSDSVISLNTFVDKNGGNFTIKLPFMPLDEKAESSIRSVLDNKENGFLSKYLKTNVAIKNFDYFKGSFNTSFDFFSSLIQDNDLIFIKFGPTNFSFREHQNTVGYSSFTMDGEVDLSEEDFDMICLVDEVSVNKTAPSGEAHVEVRGRDLIKLLIEDSSNFFQISTTSNPQDIFCNVKNTGDASTVDFTNMGVHDSNSAIRRLMGEIDIFSNRTNMSISYILKGVISQLTNIEVVNNNLFTKWGDKRTTITEFKVEKNGNK